MSDLLSSLSRHPAVRSLIRGLGLPTPVALQRASGPCVALPLSAARVVLNDAGDTAVARALLAVLVQSGATLLAEDAGPAQATALLFDATALRSVAQCGALYDYFQPRLAALPAQARVLVLAASPEHAGEPAAAAVARGCEGFVRSLAKELGRWGSTANLIYVEPDAAHRLEGPVRFLLSPRSVFVSGQPLRVSATAAAAPRATAVQPLRDKIALVTGAAQGLGAATALRLSEEGAQVICVDIPASASALESTAQRVGGSALLLDVTAPDAPQQLADLLGTRHGGVDVLVHNAGVIRDRTLAKMDAQRWDRCLAMNLDAILRIDSLLIDSDLLHDEGRIVCLSSIAGVAGNVGQTNYALTKAAVIGYVAAQARRLAARGITVNAVAPGLIETPMMLSMPFVWREVARRMNSLSQAGVPLDVAEAVTFLSTPSAVGITGQTLRVCGQNLIGA